MNILLAFSQPISDATIARIAWTLVRSLWQLALVALFAAAAMKVMHRASSQARYGMLVLAMAASVAIPIATCMHQGDAAERGTSQAAIAQPSQYTAASPKSAEPVDQPPIARQTDGYAADAPAQSSSRSIAPYTAENSAPPTLWLQLRSTLQPWFIWIVAIWFAGVLIFSIRPLLGWRMLSRLKRIGTSPVSDEIAAALHRVSQRVGLGRATTVFQSTIAQVPIVIGYFKPVILLPVSVITNIPLKQLEAILAHELAHVQRHDFLVNLMQTCVEALFFYHPAVWWLSRQIRIEREHCCDDLVLRTMGNRVEYGRALLAIEELRGQPNMFALAATGGSLLARIRRIASAGPEHRARSFSDRWPAAILGVLLIGAICLTFDHPLAAGDQPTPVKPAQPNRAAGADPADISPTGEIAGRLLDTAGKPIPGATIACGAIINDSGKGGGANAVTDADGRYRLLVPSPGIYNVWLKKYDKDSTKTAAADDAIQVEAGKVAASQLQLLDGIEVAGKVVNAAGKPFASMEVYCYSAARPPSGGVQSAKTRADGAFQFYLPPGRAHVYAAESAGTPDNPLAIGLSADVHITVPANGDVAPIKLTMENHVSKFGDPVWLNRSTPGTQIIEHKPKADVTGTVVDETGKPVAGAKVFREDAPPVSTNEKGEFHVKIEKGTQFVMHAVAPGYHAWFGTPTSGDVLKIVLESKSAKQAVDSDRLFEQQGERPKIHALPRPPYW